jgi:hypothetical protein
VLTEERLLELASAVAEGSGVNWQDAERETADGDDRSVIQALHVLATIADVASDAILTRTASTRRADLISADAHPTTWGDLRILGCIGEGSYGVVYRAFDTRLQREVAVKLARPTAASANFDVSRTLREARVLARVRHPGVVSVLGADSHDSRFGLWMELIKGRTLKDLVAVNGTMSAQEAAAVGVELCHALAAVHRAGLLHRDIKASNVMREDGGRIVLMDFGAVRRIPGPEEPSGAVAGTPQYIAPELLVGRKPSAASDIYSLGTLLFYLVSSQYPVQHSRSEYLVAMHQRPRVSLRDLRPELPASFVDVIERALSVDPADRYRTAGQFGAALAAVAGTRYARDPMGWSAWRVAAAAAIGTAGVWGIVQMARTQAPDAGRQPDTTSALSAPIRPAAYQVAASLYAVRNNQNVRLMTGSRVQPGDRLFLSLEASQPVFVYIVNQDQAGNGFLLFPLPGYQPGNPLPLGGPVRLPGARDGEPHFWQVTSAGVREHFMIYVAPDRLTDLEQVLAALPRAERGRPVEHLPLTVTAMTLLRGIGGVTPAGTASPGTPLVELQPLPATIETTTGLWARRITLDNPAK